MAQDITALIRQLKGKELTDYQVIETLQQQGHSAQEITNALDAVRRQDQYMQPQPGVNSMQQPQNPMQFQPQSITGVPPQQPFMPPPANGPQQGQDTDEIEELIEAIIDEKWQEVQKNIDRIINWKEQTDQKIAKMGQQITDMQSQFDKVHNAVLGKVGEYDKHIKNVGAQLEAMEKVFSDVLPTFTQNVNTLNRVTQRMTGPRE